MKTGESLRGEIKSKYGERALGVLQGGGSCCCGGGGQGFKDPIVADIE